MLLFVKRDFKSKLFGLFLVIISLRFLTGIFNLTFVAEIYNRILHYIFVVFILYVLFKFRNEETKKYTRYVKYIPPIIIIVTTFLFENVLAMIIPYILYFILDVFILPLFEKKTGWKNLLRFFLIGVLSILIILIIVLNVLFKDFGSLSVRDEFAFPSDINKKLIVIEYDDGALGGSTEVIYQEKIAKTGLKCEKQILSGSWSTEYNLESIYKEITKIKTIFCGINIDIK